MILHDCYHEFFECYLQEIGKKEFGAVIRCVCGQKFGHKFMPKRKNIELFYCEHCNESWDLEQTVHKDKDYIVLIRPKTNSQIWFEL